MIFLCVFFHRFLLMDLFDNMVFNGVIQTVMSICGDEQLLAKYYADFTTDHFISSISV